jgi:hypothetical protein
MKYYLAVGKLLWSRSSEEHSGPVSFGRYIQHCLPIVKATKILHNTSTQYHSFPYSHGTIHNMRMCYWGDHQRDVQMMSCLGITWCNEQQTCRCYTRPIFATYWYCDLTKHTYAMNAFHVKMKILSCWFYKYNN